MKKNRIILIISSLLVLFFSLAGCNLIKNNGQNVNSSISNEETKKEMLLSSEALDLIVGDETKLTAYNYVKQEDVTLQYESSDSSVVEVDETGNIFAKKDGSAVITVTYGKEKKTCNVNVGFGGMVPMLDFKQVVGNDVSLSYGGTLNLDCVVVFNGKEYEDLEVVYTTTGDIGQIEAESKQFSANQTAGSGTITATATWRGMNGSTVKTLQKEITVQVIHTVAIVTNFNSYVLYPVSLFDGKTYETQVNLTVNVYENQTKKEYKDIRVSEDSADIIALDETNMQISAKKFGTGIVEIEYVDTFNETHVKEIEIQVERPIKTLTKTIEFSAMDGTLPLTDIFGKEVVLLNAYQDGTALTVSPDGQTIGGLKLEENAITYSTLLIYDNEVGYQFPITAYKKILRTAADFKVFNEAGKLTGYYYLANDVNDYGEVGHFKMVSSTSCFAGIFDGGGHYANLTVTTNRGLFVYLNAATIKNVQFNLKINPPNTTSNYQNMAGLAASLWTNVKITDTYVKIVEISKNLVGSFAPISNDIPKNISFTRTVIEMPTEEYFKENEIDTSKMSALGNSVAGFEIITTANGKVATGKETVKWNASLGSEIFVISHLPLARYIWDSYVKYEFTVYAPNVMLDTNEDGDISEADIDAENKITYLGQTRNAKGGQIYVYPTKNTLIQAALNLDLYLENALWDISTGIPVFNGKD